MNRVRHIRRAPYPSSNGLAENMALTVKAAINSAEAWWLIILFIRLHTLVY